MNFEARLTVSPPGSFGLPDGDATVIPVDESGESKVFGAVLDTRLGVLAGHGTLPLYRREEDAIDAQGEISGLQFSIRDNSVSVTGEADSRDDALRAIESAMTRLAQHLTVTHGTRFTAHLEALECEGSPPPDEMAAFQILNVRTYNLRGLRQHLNDAFIQAGLTDDRLLNAIRYYDAALQVSSLTPRGVLAARVPSPLVVVEFLCLWKALTTILGDPAVRGDGHQRRYRELGFDEDVRDQFRQLKMLRDKADIAHYSLDPTALDRVRGCLGRARTLARRVIDGFRTRLLEHSSE